jgi:hypothetical protein
MTADLGTRVALVPNGRRLRLSWQVKTVLGAALLTSVPFWLLPDAPAWRKLATAFALVFGSALVLDGTLSRR